MESTVLGHTNSTIADIVLHDRDQMGRHCVALHLG